MRATRLLSAVGALCCGLAALPVMAASPVPAAPALDATSYVLMDHRTGRILAEKDPDARAGPASITKVMTAYIVFDELADGRLSMDDQVRISEKAWRIQGSEMFLLVDERVSVRELLDGMIIQSGNDAAIALAEHVAGSEDVFADLMNQYAAELGMENTHFVNASGWPDPEHYSTARDLALLGRAIVRDFPEQYRTFAEQEYQYKEFYPQGNRNALLARDSSVDGIKTGHTEDSGYSLLASAERDGMRLISALMGSSGYAARFDASQALLNYGFRFFESHRLYAAGESVTDVRVWKGTVDRVGLTVNEPLYISIPRGRYEDLEAEMDLATELMAPVAADADLGEVRVSLDGQVLARARLVPVSGVPEGGLFKRIQDTVLLWFQ